MKKFVASNLLEGQYINDPDLAMQYQNGQNQLIQKDQLIVKLQTNINKLETAKMKIEKEMNKIAADDAKNRPEEETDTNTQNSEETTVEVQGTPVEGTGTNESLLVSVNEAMDEYERIQSEIDQMADQLIYLQEHDPDPLEIEEIQKYIKNLIDKQRYLETDQMEHESEYDIFNESEDDEPRFSGMYGSIEDNYELNKEGRPIKRKENVRSPKQRKQRPWSDSKMDKYDQLEKDIRTLGYEIEDIESDIKYQMERFQSPEDADMEAEEFFGQIGFEAADIINSGITEKEKIKSLKKLGKKDAEDLIQTYYYLYPEFDPSLDKPRKENEKEIKKLQAQIDSIKKKVEKKEEQMEKMGSPVYVWESHNPMSANNFYKLNEDFAEIADTQERNEEEYLDKPYVFYLSVEEKTEIFIAKIYKVSPDGDWFGKVIEGKSPTFEKVSYDPDYTENDIVYFLEETYDNVQIIDPNYTENKDVEESWPSNTIASRGPITRY